MPKPKEIAFVFATQFEGDEAKEIFAIATSLLDQKPFTQTLQKWYEAKTIYETANREYILGKISKDTYELKSTYKVRANTLMQSMYIYLSRNQDAKYGH